jgi:hypothetical protein
VVGPEVPAAEVVEAPLPSSRRLRILVAALVVALLATTAASIILYVDWHAARAQDDRERQVLKVSRDFTTALFNFDAKSVDADFDRIIAFGTGKFLDQAKQNFGSDIRQALIQRQASSRGQVRFLFVEDVKANSADVFVVEDQQIFNNVLKAPEADEVRADIALTRVNGAWRVSDLTVLQSPPVASGPGPTTP